MTTVSAPFPPAGRPTFYFIGVTTGQSSIMRVFPAWARHLGLDAEMRGIDLPLHADPAAYREVVSFIKHDPLSLGALVTTHKIDLFKAAHDLFDTIDPMAALMEETSCLSKPGGRLVCHAKDPLTSGLALESFLPPEHFATTGGELFAMGAGGSTIAMTYALTRPERGADRPARIVVSDPDGGRLDELQRIHREIGTDVPLTLVRPAGLADNDRIVTLLKPGSLVVNATGLGKDRPGSPLTDAARFPQGGIAWELNYRGDLVFLDQARAQAEERGLQVEDGWTYFLYGWTQVIAEVFAIDMPRSGPGFATMSDIAARASKG